MTNLYNCKMEDVIDNIKFDAIITDPPYNVGYHYNTYKDNLSEEEYKGLFLKMKGKCKNISIMHYPVEAVKYFTSTIGVPDRVTSWVYNSNTPKQTRLIFNYGEIYKDQVRQPYKNPNDKRIKQRIADGKVDAKAYDWWYINQVKNVSKTKTGNTHSCPIPFELAEKMVLLTTKEGDTVFDPFMGSGTVALACIKHNRKFIGCELDREYFEIAEERINEFRRIH